MSDDGEYTFAVAKDLGSFAAQKGVRLYDLIEEITRAYTSVLIPHLKATGEILRAGLPGMARYQWVEPKPHSMSLELRLDEGNINAKSTTLRFEHGKFVFSMARYNYTAPALPGDLPPLKGPPYLSEVEGDSAVALIQAMHQEVDKDRFSPFIRWTVWHPFAGTYTIT